MYSCVREADGCTRVVSGTLVCDQLAVGSIGLWPEHTVATSLLSLAVFLPSVLSLDFPAVLE